MTIITPLSRLPMVSWKAKPRMTPVIPSPASTGPMSRPMCCKKTTIRKSQPMMLTSCRMKRAIRSLIFFARASERFRIRVSQIMRILPTKTMSRPVPKVIRNDTGPSCVHTSILCMSCPKNESETAASLLSAMIAGCIYTHPC
ncbi:hypothetical protein DSECCO2_430370 [anaerobic digester metagenome]